MADRLEEILLGGDAREIIQLSLNARIKADNGEWCTCAKPSLRGLDLLCGHCLLQNKDQERAKVRSMVAPHEFEPRGTRGIREFMCVVCSRWKDDPRHAGDRSAVGRTSWGEEIRP